MDYQRMSIEVESPEQLGYGSIRFNLAESSVTDAVWDDLHLDLRGLKLQYGDHYGNPELRALLAADAGIRPDDVLLTVGAASALFIVHTTLLQAGDEVVVAFPNYGTNLETPRAIGCQIKRLELRFEDGWKLDLEALERLVTPRTKLISLTTPHNPTGTLLSATDLHRALEIAARVGAKLLLDETYREMSFTPPPPMAASLAQHAITVSSLSKTYGLPGIRLGWLMTQDAALMQRFLAAKEQIFICGSILDEEIAAQAMRSRAGRLEQVRGHIHTNFHALKGWMARQEHLTWVEPGGGVVAFPRLSQRVSTDAFYRELLEKHGTYVGPGHWFDMSDQHFRLGYGWTPLHELQGGLDGIEQAIAAALG